MSSVSSIHAVHHAPAHFNAAALRNASPEEQRTAVAQQFEAILVRQLMGKTLSSMLGGEGKGGASASIYGDMLTDTFAQQLTAGQGLGLGRFIQKQLTPRGESAAVQGTEQPADPAESSKTQNVASKGEAS